MNRVLLGKSLPESLSLLDKGIPPSSSGSVNSGTTSLVRDIWSREFCERTGDTAHRRNSEPAVRWRLKLIAITHGNLGGLKKVTHSYIIFLTTKSLWNSRRSDYRKRGRY